MNTIKRRTIFDEYIDYQENLKKYGENTSFDGSWQFLRYTVLKQK